MNIDEIVLEARRQNASDIHMSQGEPVVFRIHGHLTITDFIFDYNELKSMLWTLLSEKQIQDFEAGNDLDFAFTSSDDNRQRVNIFKQLGNVSATIRLLNNHIPTIEELGLPSVLNQLTKEKRGLILVTGPTGSGKSTTLAAMINEINQTRAEHILTVEDPIEYVYPKNKSIIHQREVGQDVKSFASALRSSLREDPDIILVGEMRDFETISAALTAAETGHLVLSTLHTTGAAQTIDRIIDACPGESQQQIRTQLTGILKGVITQCLVPTINQKRIVATEVLIGTDAVLNLIRENKCHQITATLQAGKQQGMHTLNMDLTRLVNQGYITKEVALQYSNDRKDLITFIGGVY
ncbi:MAG: type IV pilus twitching motility protein PilT [Thomasclavelia sp.]|uniref:type IV pilus twitching motility protein PilT n=1 Tax=Thomasclavelia sp. TaxID=3025757 RepID=UPI0039A28280